MESSRPSAQRIHEEIVFLTQLWKTNKFHFFIVVVLLLFAGWAVVSQVFTIPGLRSELARRDAEMQHLEQKLLPFQTAAVEKFNGLSEDEALSTLATRIGQVELGLTSILDYQEVSTWGATGMMKKQVAAMTSIDASPVSGWNDGLWKITSSDGTDVSDVTDFGTDCGRVFCDNGGFPD